MVKKKLNLMERYKIWTIIIILFLMLWCQIFNYLLFKKTIEIPKQMWTIIGLIVTNLFMGRITEVVATKSSVHTKGIVLLSLMILVSISIGFSLEVGKEIWGIVGGVIAFVFRSEAEED